jgi:transketolase
MDWNFKQIDGDTREVMHPKDMEGKWRSFGWDVIRLKEGNDIHAVLNTLQEARSRTGKGKPVIILMNTTMGKGVDFMEDRYEWHGKPPSKEEFEKAIAQLPETIGDY